MIPETAPDRPLTTLLRLQAGAGVIAFAAAVAGVFLAGNDGSPTWLGLIIVVGVGFISTFAVRWYRQRPIEVGHFDVYRQTVVVRLLIALAASVVGAVMSIVGESPWPAVVGGMTSIMALALAPVSAEDYDRHQRIFIEQSEPPPEEVWNTADPDAAAPWDVLEEGHGHGMKG
ncbi:MAG: hypothetical protein V3R84_08355 [Acidimicrobiia bacterium]